MHPSTRCLILYNVIMKQPNYGDYGISVIANPHSQMRHLQYLNEGRLAGTQVRNPIRMARQSNGAIESCLCLCHTLRWELTMIQLAKMNRWRAVAMILDIRPPICRHPTNILEGAIDYSGDLAIRLVQLGVNITLPAVEKAAASRNLKLMREIAKRMHVPHSAYHKAMNCPAMIEYLLSIEQQPPISIMKAAIDTRNPEVIMAVRRHVRPNKVNSYHAGLTGDLDVISLMLPKHSGCREHCEHSGCREHCEQVCAGAAAHGHLDVIKHYGPGNTTELLLKASGGGHVNVIDYLRDHLNDYTAHRMIERAIQNNRLNVIQRLVAYISDASTDGYTTTNYITLARESADPGIAEYLESMQ